MNEVDRMGVLARCPVCGGNGLLPNGFYMQTTGAWTTVSTATEPCRSCDGRGVIEPQLAGAVEDRDEAVALLRKAAHRLVPIPPYAEIDAWLGDFDRRQRGQ